MGGVINIITQQPEPAEVVSPSAAPWSSGYESNGDSKLARLTSMAPGKATILPLMAASGTSATTKTATGWKFHLFQILRLRRQAVLPPFIRITACSWAGGNRSTATSCTAFAHGYPRETTAVLSARLCSENISLQAVFRHLQSLCFQRETTS